MQRPNNWLYIFNSARDRQTLKSIAEWGWWHGTAENWINVNTHTHTDTRYMNINALNGITHLTTTAFELSCHTCWVSIQALTPLFRALLHPLPDKQDSPPLQHYCWSHLLHTPHTEAQLWIWNGTLGGCEIPFPHQRTGSWDLLWPSRLRTTSDFLCIHNIQQRLCTFNCVL